MTDPAAAGATALLEVRGLSGRGISCEELTVGVGECVAVTGASGAGKTLLLRAIADLDPAAGEVRLGGESRQRIDGPRWRRQVMLVPAEPAWWSVQVLDHFFRRPPPALLERLGFTDETLDWAIDRLSTGERQRLALARALVLEPRLLMLDEPTSALDEESKADVEVVLREFLASGGGMLLISHEAAQVARLASHGARVVKGRVEATAP